MVDKLIWGKIVEIIVVIAFVIISIPIWKNFNEKVSSAKVTTLDDYNLYFEVNKNEFSDNIMVMNEYYINKNYKIQLIVNGEIDDLHSNVRINDLTYNLSEFYCETKENSKIFTLIDKYISADVNYYDIEPLLVGGNNNYLYNFKENNVF